MYRVRSLVVLCLECISRNTEFYMSIVSRNENWSLLATDGDHWTLSLPEDLKNKIYNYIDDRGWLTDSALCLYLTKRNFLDLEDNTFITDHALYHMAHRLGTFTTLKLTDCVSITDTGLQVIAEKCSLLKVLNISGCYNVTCAGLESLRRYATNLTELDCGEIPFEDPGLVSLFSMPNLMILGIAECTKICLTFKEGKPPVCPSLKSLCSRSVPSVSDVTLSGILELVPALKILDLSFCNDISDKTIETIANNKLRTSITSLNVWGANITDDGIALLTSSCTQLQSLTICRCNAVTENSIIQIIANLKKLNVLNLWGCQGISAVSLQLLLKYVSTLKTLGLNQFTHLQDYSLVGLEKCTSLSCLEFDSCQNLTDKAIVNLGGSTVHCIDVKRCTHLSPDSLIAVLRRSTELWSLNLSACTQFSSADLGTIVCSQLNHGHGTLTQLNLSDCPNIESSVAIQILNHHPNLKCIKFDKCTKIENHVIRYILDRLPHLLELSLMFCPQLTDDAFIPSSHYTTLDRYCPGVPTAEDDQDLPDLVPMVQDQERPWGLFQLRTLYLGGSSGLTSRAIIYLAQHCPKLKTMSIPAIPGIGDSVLFQLGKNCPHLQHLNVALCPQITSIGLRSLLRRCQNIKTLDCGGLENLTDEALCLIMRHCGALKTLDISKTVHLTEKAIAQVVLACPSLNTLRVNARSKDYQLDSLFLESLQKMLPNLRIIKNY